MNPLKPTWPQPSHPEILEVVQSNNLSSSGASSFTSFSRSTISAPPGALLVTLSSPPLTLNDKAYSTVQVSAKPLHVALNCDFLYLNHSCEPSLELHVVPRIRTHQQLLDVEGTARDVPYVIEVRVTAAATRDRSGQVVSGRIEGLHVGDDMTFFYPSTEWEMDQPFYCTCQSRNCQGQISGAKDMSVEKLKGYFLNHHILEMVKRT